MENECDPQRSSVTQAIRRDRFSNNLGKPNLVSAHLIALGESYDSLLIDTWRHKYWSLEGLEKRLRPVIFVKLSFRQVVEQAIEGILIESQNFGEIDISKAKEMVRQLSDILQNDDRDKLTRQQEDAVLRCCGRLYTGDSFLYKLVNETLRNEDLTKVDTLGAYCWLLQSFISWTASIPRDITTVYRGSELSEDDIEEYRHLIGKTMRWHAFTSTSRYKEVAEAFSTNTLFVITLDRKDYNTHQEHNISSISQFPDEDEVLLVPDHNFIVQDVTGSPSNGNTGRWLIYLKCNHLVPMLPGE